MEIDIANMQIDDITCSLCILLVHRVVTRTFSIVTSSIGSGALGGTRWAGSSYKKIVRAYNTRVGKAAKYKSLHDYQTRLLTSVLTLIHIFETLVNEGLLEGKLQD